MKTIFPICFDTMLFFDYYEYCHSSSEIYYPMDDLSFQNRLLKHEREKESVSSSEEEISFRITDCRLSITEFGVDANGNQFA
jgi:hypothetical protein